MRFRRRAGGCGSEDRKKIICGKIGFRVDNVLT